MEIKKQENVINKFLKKARARKIFKIFQKESLNIFYAFFAEFLVIFVLLFILQQNNFQTDFSFGLLKLLFMVILISSFIYGTVKAIVNKPSLAKIAFEIDQKTKLSDLISSAYFFLIEDKKTDSMKFVIQTCYQYIVNEHKEEKYFLLKGNKRLFFFPFTVILLLLLVLYFPATKYNKFSKNAETGIEKQNRQKKDLSSQKIMANSQKANLPRTNRTGHSKKIYPNDKQQKNLPAKIKKQAQLKNEKKHTKNQRKRKNKEDKKRENTKQSNKKVNNKTNKQRSRKKQKRYISHKIRPLFGQGENWILNKKLHLSSPGKESKNSNNNNSKKNVLEYQVSNKFKYQIEKYMQNSTIPPQHRKAIKNYFRLIQP